MAKKKNKGQTFGNKQKASGPSPNQNPIVSEGKKKKRKHKKNSQDINQETPPNAQKTKNAPVKKGPLTVNDAIYRRLKEKVNKMFPIQNIPSDPIPSPQIFQSLWEERLNYKDNSQFHPDNSIWQIDSNAQALDAIISIINNATQTIMVSSFLINESKLMDALLAAYERNVRIYLLTSSRKFNQKLSDSDPDYLLNSFNQHLALLDHVAGKFLIRCSDHFHAKFILCDPLTPKKQGFLSTANFTKEALQDRLELLKQLESEQIDWLYRLFKCAFWTDANFEMTEGGTARVLNNTEKASIPLKFSYFEEIYPKMPFTFKMYTYLRDQLMSFIDSIDDDLYVSSFGLDPDHMLLEKLYSHIEKGYKVIFFTRPRPEKMNFITKIAEKDSDNITIYGDDRLHAKFVIPQHKTMEGYLFTANLEPKGLDEGFEVGFKLSTKEVIAIQMIAQEWQESFPFTVQINKNVSDLIGNTNVRIVSENNQSDQKKFQILKVEENYSISLKSKEMNSLHSDPLELVSFDDYETYQKQIPIKESENKIFKTITAIQPISYPVAPIGTQLEKQEKVTFHLKDQSKSLLGIKCQEDLESYLKQEKTNQGSFDRIVFFDIL